MESLVENMDEKVEKLGWYWGAPIKGPVKRKNRFIRLKRTWSHECLRF